MLPPAIPPLLPTLILVNLTAHMALSGGKLSGALFTLRSGWSEAVMGIYLALFASVPLFSSLWVGRWIDRAGALHVMRRGIALLLAGAWLPVAWLSIPTLFAMAMLLGIGFNLVSMSGLQSVGVLSSGHSDQSRLANFGWFGLGFATSAALGPAASGLLIDELGFRAAFAGMALFTCVAALLVLLPLRTLPQHRKPPAARHPDGAPPAWNDLMTTPALRRIFLVGLALNVGWDLYTALLPVLGTRLGFSASVIGSIASMFAVGIVISRLLTPWLATRFHEWQNVRAALTCMTLVFLVLPWADAPATFMVLGFAFGSSVGLSQPNTLSLLHAATPSGRAGEALGLRFFLGNCSSVLLPFLFGLVVVPFGPAPVMWAGAALVGAGLPAVNRALRQR
ncbi:MAG: MFS transporter [Burkholderiales bacterium]|nr:MFS transporter [Burkholderiales bacterium]